jgi:hypothetical protein
LRRIERHVLLLLPLELMIVALLMLLVLGRRCWLVNVCLLELLCALLLL